MMSIYGYHVKVLNKQVLISKRKFEGKLSIKKIKAIICFPWQKIENKTNSLRIFFLIFGFQTFRTFSVIS